MLQRYREIVIGIVFGIAAMVIDTGMDAKVEGTTLAGELAAHPGMMLYRLGFVLLGLAFGWLLWQNNKRERQFRLLRELFHNFQEQCGTQALLLCSSLQLLLTRDDFRLADEAQRALHDAYEKAHELQKLADQKMPDTAA